MELVQAWYLENLLWDELAGQRRRAAQERERQQLQRDREQRERERRDGERRREEDDDHADWVDDDIVPELQYDQERDDRLMCFWISDNSSDPENPGTKRMYVCVDPDTGAIIPQYIEKEDAPTQ